MFKNALKYLVRCVGEQKWLFLCLYLTSVLITLLSFIMLSDTKDDLFYGIFFPLSEVYLVCFLLYLLPAKVRRLLSYLIVFAAIVAAGVEIFLILEYHTVIRPYILMLTAQTDARESSEFISMMFHSSAFWLSLASSLVLIVLMFSAKVKCQRRSMPVYTTVLVTILIILSATRQIVQYRCIYDYWAAPADILIEELQQPIATTSFSRTLWGYVCIDKIIESNKLLCKTVENTEKYPIIDVDAPKEVVLIIGESYNKHHSRLYNPAYRNTTPQLCKLRDDSLLYVFDDVITYSNLTDEVFHNLFSIKSSEQKGNLANYTLFTAILKKAGVYVDFISNQYSFNCQDLHDVSGSGMFNFSTLSHNQFSYRNNNSYPYDELLISEVKPVDNLWKRLTIFHLYGQHFKYEDRCPDSLKVFKSSLIHTPYGKDAAEVIANYDNATLYNDKVVTDIMKHYANRDAMVIYLSDHGEEVYDYRDFYCRTHTPTESWDELHNQYEVPFMIYLSPMAKQQHPSLVGKLQNAVHRPFMTDDFPHMITNLMGVKATFYDSKRDLLSSDYNAKRKRIIWCGTDYDKIRNKQ